MGELQSLVNLPEDFDGRVRLFPLPGLVLFPHVLQPLHIFEPRYCDLLEASLASDRLIAMATLAAGWEANYAARPAIETPVCIGRILMHARAEEGHNILLLGLKRGVIRRELPAEQTYRMAEIDLVEDFYSPHRDAEREILKQSLLDRFEKFVTQVPLVRENLKQLADQLLPLGPVTDLAAFATPLSVDEKLRLLANGDVDHRAETLIRALESKPNPSAGAALMEQMKKSTRGPSAEFPPPFSLN